jgi:hypothetical protein
MFLKDQKDVGFIVKNNISLRDDKNVLDKLLINVLAINFNRLCKINRF